MNLNHQKILYFRHFIHGRKSPDDMNKSIIIILRSVFWTHCGQLTLPTIIFSFANSCFTFLTLTFSFSSACFVALRLASTFASFSLVSWWLNFSRSNVPLVLVRLASVLINLSLVVMCLAISFASLSWKREMHNIISVGYLLKINNLWINSIVL